MQHTVTHKIHFKKGAIKRLCIVSGKYCARVCIFSLYYALSILIVLFNKLDNMKMFMDRKGNILN